MNSRLVKEQPLGSAGISPGGFYLLSALCKQTIVTKTKKNLPHASAIHL